MNLDGEIKKDMTVGNLSEEMTLKIVEWEKNDSCSRPFLKIWNEGFTVVVVAAWYAITMSQRLCTNKMRSHGWFTG